MATDDQYALLYNKKIISFDQMKSKLVDYMVSQIRSYGADTFSTDAALGASIVPLAAASTANKVDIAKLTTFSAVTGNGRKIKTIVNADSRLQGIKIPPNAGVLYHVGIEQNDVESGIEVNPRTGKFQYVSFLEQMGRVANPTSVVDNGNGTLTINVNSLTEAADDHSGRSVRVWLKSAENGGPGPKSGSAAVAIQTIAITFGGGNNTILVPNVMGQSTASTTATDYMVQLVGPVVKRQTTEDLRNTAGCFFLGVVTSVANGNLITTIDTSSQNVVSIGLADVDTRIVNLETDMDAMERSVVLTGFNNTSNVGLTFNIAAGTCLMSGTVRAPLGQGLALTNNATLYVYVDVADNTIKFSSGFPPPASLALWQVTTAAGAITLVIDMRRLATRNNSRAFITVGATNCDFTTLDGAFIWLGNNRQANGEIATQEVVIQENVTMARQISLQFPVTVRGVAVDGTAVGAGSPRVKVITPAGVAAFMHGTAPLASVVFKDLYFSVPTGSAGSGFLAPQASVSIGDDWRFENCVFDGGKDTPMFNFVTVPNATVYSGWIWDKCVFKNGTHTSAQSYIALTGVGTTTAATGFVFRGCRFLGETADLFVQGITFDQATSEAMVDHCEFNMGGFQVLCRTAADQISIRKCRFKNSRAAALSIATDGEVNVEECYSTNCQTNGSGADGVIRITTVSAHGGGITTIRGCRIKNWATTSAIYIDAGNDHRIESNIITTNVATPTIGVRLAVGITGVDIINNDIDMSTGAAAGSGKASATCILHADGTVLHNRVIGNKFRNCGSNATGAGPVVQIGGNTVMMGNLFMNCRGQLITNQGDNNVIMGNVDQAGDTSATTIRVQLGGINQILMGNVLRHATAGSKAYDYSGPGGTVGIRAFGNAVDLAFALFGSGSWPTGNCVRKRVTFDPPTTSVGAGATVVVATVAQPAHSQGVHLPCSASLAASLSANTYQAGIRLTFTDNTTQDIINATAGIVAQDVIGTNGLITTTVDDNAVAMVQFVNKNTSGGTLNLDIGASTYEGYIIC